MAELRVQVSDRTVTIIPDLHSLIMVAVPRDCRGLGDEWESPGIYVLLGALANITCRVYVGQAKKLRTRIRQHHKNPPFVWTRALLVRHANANSFGLSEIGWLEGRIHGLLEAGGVDLVNDQRPGDVPLRETSKEGLEFFAGFIQDALVLLGYDPEGHSAAEPVQTAELEPEDARPATTGKVPGKFHRNLLDIVRAGTQIESTSRKHPATAIVEATGTRYQGELFGSPSAAATAVTGHDTDNGWLFWGVRSDSGEVVSLKRLRDQTSNRTSTVRDARNAQFGDRQRRTRPNAVTPRNAKSKTTPKKMSATRVNDFLARKDEGATYPQLKKEFGLTTGSVYKLLLENGRVKERRTRTRRTP